MIVDNTVQKVTSPAFQMSNPVPLVDYNARTQMLSEQNRRQQGQLPQRESVKNVGGSSLFVSHPLSIPSWKLIADDMRRR